jgi:hypothetical protein
VIEDVEELGAKLQVEPLRKWEGLGKRDVRFDKTRALQNVTTNVAISSRQRRGERDGVEIQIWSASDYRASEIGTGLRVSPSLDGL